MYEGNKTDAFQTKAKLSLKSKTDGLEAIRTPDLRRVKARIFGVSV